MVYGSMADGRVAVRYFAWTVRRVAGRTPEWPIWMARRPDDGLLRMN